MFRAMTKLFSKLNTADSHIYIFYALKHHAFPTYAFLSVSYISCCLDQNGRYCLFAGELRERERKRKWQGRVEGVREDKS